MANNELLIKISADAKNAQKAFEDVKSQTEDLENTLAKVATVSAVAFAAFTAEIFLAESAFRDAQKSAIELTNALQNQGIFTQDLVATYKEYADVVQDQTGIDNDAVISAQAVAQTYLGQTRITQELTNAIADLGAQMGGDLNGAAEKIARTIGTNTNAFARQGLVIQEGATEAERYAAVLEFVRTKAGGLALDLSKADGNAQRLSTAFGNFQEAIGERFAPVLAAARGIVASFFTAFDKFPILADLAASLLAAGVAVTGLITALALGVSAFTAITAAAAAFGVTVNIAFAGIPLAIGAVVAAITFLALNWEKSINLIKANLTGLIIFTDQAFSGLAEVIAGAFTLDTARIGKGIEQVKGAYAAAANEASSYYAQLEAIRTADATKQEADRKAQADKEAQAERQKQNTLKAIKATEIELMRLQDENASAERIALKTRELETLKALETEGNAQARAILQQRLVDIRADEDAARAEDIERQKAFAAAMQEAKTELMRQGLDAEITLSEERLAILRGQAQTETDINNKLQEDLLKKRIEANNKRLLDAKKFGEAYAAINKVLQSDEVQGAKTAADELVKLQQSKSQELKAIGKAAALAQIAIATAESAMNIYRGFSTIPIVGPALGIAGAAAAVAFGGERAADIIKAADGGLIEGGIPGRDSVPAFLMPGELVVPRRNFNDVVGAVQANNGGSNADILEALRDIKNTIQTPSNYIFNGDLSTDEAFVDNFVKKISDAIEFRNAQIFGVT